MATRVATTRRPARILVETTSFLSPPGELLSVPALLWKDIEPPYSIAHPEFRGEDVPCQSSNPAGRQLPFVLAPGLALYREPG